MKLFYISVLHHDGTFIESEYSIFSKSKLSATWNHHSLQLLRFISQSIVSRLKEKANENKGDATGNAEGSMFSVTDKDFRVHCSLQKNAKHVIVITDQDYPEPVAYRILEKIVSMNENQKEQEEQGEQKEQEYLMNIFSFYEDPLNDTIYRMKKDIEETKQILHSSIEKLFLRGEKLEDLIAKTDQLSQETKSFFRRTKKVNRWCPLFPWF